jgi:hypothetical protein
MLGLFKSPPASAPGLGELQRSGGVWRGTVMLGERPVPLMLDGPRTGPEDEALRLARAIPNQWAAWRQPISAALFEHYEPYGDADDGESLSPMVDGPGAAWSLAQIRFVSVAKLGGDWTVEIGIAVPWDEDHLLGARFRDGEWFELCGSV